MAETADRRIGAGGRIAVYETHKKLRAKWEKAGYPKGGSWEKTAKGTRRVMDKTACRERLEDLKDPKRVEERVRLHKVRERYRARKEG